MRLPSLPMPNLIILSPSSVMWTQLSLWHFNKISVWFFYLKKVKDRLCRRGSLLIPLLRSWRSRSSILSHLLQYKSSFKLRFLLIHVHVNFLYSPKSFYTLRQILESSSCACYSTAPSFLLILYPIMIFLPREIQAKIS